MPIGKKMFRLGYIEINNFIEKNYPPNIALYFGGNIISGKRKFGLLIELKVEVTFMSGNQSENIDYKKILRTTLT